jgi:streptogramin lyase
VKLVTALVLLLGGATAALAHPGVGIVMDRGGNVFYTDLAQIWRIAPDGTRSVAVPNVHSHELFLDPKGTLHGEHLWNVGERWLTYEWRLTSTGVLTKSPQREAFREDWSLVRDSAGRMYWYSRTPSPAIVRRSPGGQQVRLAGSASFVDVRWMTAAADGAVYFTDNGDLRKLTAAGSVVTLAAGLRERPDHWVGGVWLDGRQRVYVALWGSRNVKRFDPVANRVEVAAQSPAPWAPSGGLTASNGDLWLLETSETNAVRVRRISTDGRERVF